MLTINVNVVVVVVVGGDDCVEFIGLPLPGFTNMREMRQTDCLLLLLCLEAVAGVFGSVART